LVDSKTKITMKDFFKTIHSKFYARQDISFMEYFLELTENEGEFIVHHEKLVEYGITSSIRSFHVKEKLDALELVEDIDYSELPDIRQMVRPQGGGKHKNIYMLTPEAFKTCLLRARRYPNQTVDPTVYSKYYLLLEKTYKLYTDYEKQLLNNQLEQNQQQLEENQLQLEQNQQQLEEERQYRLDLQDSLIDNNKELEKTQIIYITTSTNYAKRNRFKVGGVESEDKLGSRLSTYNTGRAAGDDLFYTNIYSVHNYREIENRLKDLIGTFRDRKSKEMYILHYSHLTYIVKYLIDHYNDEVDEINKKLGEFIKDLNIRILRPAIVKPLNIAYIQQTGRPDVTLTADSETSLNLKMEEYIKSLDTTTVTIKAKDVFDNIGLKTGRRSKYPTLIDVITKILPNAKMVRF
jgi:autonomous glycyl radical cofactor GrcA